MKWIGQNIYDQVSKFRNTVDFSEDVTFYQPINNGNPTISLGSSATNRLEIKSTYNSGTQALCDIDFTTYTSSSSGNDGRFNFYVDEVQKLVLNDNSLSTFCSVLATVDGAEFQAKDTTASSDGGGGKLTLVCDDGAAMGDDHRLGVIEFKGAEDEDGNTTVGARIEAMCDAAWSSTENGGRLDFYTTDADAGGGKVLTLDSNKQATFGGGVAVTGVITGNAGVVSVETDHLKITSTNANDPLVQIKNETDDASGPRLKFNKLRGADGQDGDSCGIIQFASFDDGTPSTQFYGQIETKIADATSGQEAGDMFFQVPSYDGVLTNGLHLDGDTDADGEVDVNIAAGAGSVTTIAGTLTMGSTATINNSGVVQVAAQTVIDHDQLANFAASEHFTQANITTVGTIGTGVWEGTRIASASLDTDTAHLSGTQTFTGTKTLNSFKGTAGATVTNILDEDAMGSDSATALATQQSIKAYADTKSALATQKQLTFHSFTDDIDTTKHYVGLVDADSESATTTGVDMPLTFPVASKLLQVTLRSNKNLSGLTYTWRLETQATGVGYGTGPTIVGTQSGAGPAQVGHAVYDFTESLDSGDNVVDAFDAVYLSIQSGGGTSNTKYFITCVWEVDVSSY